MRVRMIKTLAPVEIPNGTEGTVISQTERMRLVEWDNGYVLPMYGDEVVELADEVPKGGKI